MPLPAKANQQSPALFKLDCGRRGRQLVGRRRRMPCNATPASRPMQTPEIYISVPFTVRCAKAGVIHMHTKFELPTTSRSKVGD
jgi:hypothetical protein